MGPREGVGRTQHRAAVLPKEVKAEAPKGETRLKTLTWMPTGKASGQSTGKGPDPGESVRGHGP